VGDHVSFNKTGTPFLPVAKSTHRDGCFQERPRFGRTETVTLATDSPLPQQPVYGGRAHMTQLPEDVIGKRDNTLPSQDTEHLRQERMEASGAQTVRSLPSHLKRCDYRRPVQTRAAAPFRAGWPALSVQQPYRCLPVQAGGGDKLVQYHRLRFLAAPQVTYSDCLGVF